MKRNNSLGFFVFSVLSIVLMLIISIVSFGITLWVVKIASKLFFGEGLEANWAVLSAAILSLGALVGGVCGKKR